MERREVKLLKSKLNEFTDAMLKNNGIITTALEAVGITFETYLRAINADSKLKAHIEFHKDMCIRINVEETEKKLLEKINKGDNISTLFYLKCKGGFVEKRQTKSDLSPEKGNKVQVEIQRKTVK